MKESSQQPDDFDIEPVFCEQCEELVTALAGDPVCAVCRPEVFHDSAEELDFSD